MAVSAVTICSNALLKLGDRPIASLDEPTDAARICSNLWPNVRDTVLRSHPWNCAVKRVTLAPDTETPSWRYAYQFSLPGDWLRTLSIGDNDYSPDYQQEGRKILCNESVLYIRYIYQNEDTTTWDRLLVDAMTAAMCAELAYPITESTSLMQAKQQELEFVMRRARLVDAQENPPIKLQPSELLNARHRGIY